jgi:hypothetical protein
LVQISAGARAVLTETFNSVPQNLQENTGILPRVRKTAAYFHILSKSSINLPLDAVYNLAADSVEI